MSLIPSFFGTGRSTNFSDPFSHDIWDPSHATHSCTNDHKDWTETPEAHVLKAHLPGLKKEEVKVEIEGRVLQISGERSKEEEEEDKNHARHHHRMERSRSGRFLRRYRLPENAKVDEVKASMENGVLTVTFPKEEVKKPVQITG